MTIVSHKYKFVFIKTQKTAGTSLEVELSGICGPLDVVTPVFPQEPKHQPRNFKLANGRTYYNHMRADEISVLCGTEIFADYFKFCVERHPIEKCISHFAMVRNSEQHNKLFMKNVFPSRHDGDLSWADYVVAGHFPMDHEKYSKGTKLVVDRILKYEQLESELASLFDELAVPWNGLNSKAKSGYRTLDIIDPSEVSLQQRERIMGAFHQSTQFTGYS